MRSEKISAAEPVTALRHVKIVDNGERLVNFLEMCPGLLLDRARFNYRRETLLRQSVAEKLCAANRNLPKGYRLAIVEGWRAPHIQQRMYRFVWERFQKEHPDWSDTQLRRTVNKFSAPLNTRVPPPHTTGAAIDLMLADQDGNACDHNSPFDAFDPHCAAFDAPGLSDAARKTRDILAAALVPTGITNYPSEFWHWTYGDQGWAYRGRHAHALYAAITPPDWKPAPEDDIDAPLQMFDAEKQQ